MPSTRRPASGWSQYPTPKNRSRLVRCDQFTDRPDGYGLVRRTKLRLQNTQNVCIDCVMYLALLHKDTDSDFGVSFPDLPGCISAGSTVEEALAEARVALALHLEGLAEEGMTTPKARSVLAIHEDKQFLSDKADALLITPVSPSSISGINTRINISVDTGALAQIDKAASAAGLSRSRFLVQSALEAR
jgi:predicted RNase H-like HicB family nuclease